MIEQIKFNIKAAPLTQENIDHQKAIYQRYHNIFNSITWYGRILIIIIFMTSKVTVPIFGFAAFSYTTLAIIIVSGYFSYKKNFINDQIDEITPLSIKNNKEEIIYISEKMSVYDIANKYFTKIIEIKRNPVYGEYKALQKFILEEEKKRQEKEEYEKLKPHLKKIGLMENK